MQSMKPIINLIKENPDLAHALADATTREERAALLAGYGIELPDAEVIKAEMKELSSVAGGMGPTTSIPISAAASAAAAF